MSALQSYRRGDARIPLHAIRAPIDKSGLPHVKIVVSLRNPVERAYSHYWELVARAPQGGINKRLTFEEKITLTPRLINEGFYDEKLAAYFDLFPRKTILVLIFEEMTENPLRHYRKVCRFLGVSDDFESPLLKVRMNSASSKLGRSKFWIFPIRRSIS